MAIQFVAVTVADRKYIYQGEEYALKQVKMFERGRITEFTNLEEFCDR